MGVAHHSNYYVWFEEARTQMLKDLGFRYRDLEENGLLLSIIDTSCRYLRPARYDQQVTIKTRIRELRKLKIFFEYEVEDETGLLLARAQTTLGALDLNLKPSRIPTPIAVALKKSQTETV